MGPGGIFRALSNIAKDVVSDNKKQEKLNRGLTQAEVDEIRAKGGSIVYHYRSNKEGTLLQDWYGRMYTKDAQGVIRRAEPKVNGKVAKKRRRSTREAALHHIKGDFGRPVKPHRSGGARPLSAHA